MRLHQFGANELPRRRPEPLKVFLSKLWGPIPWMLEATIVLEAASDRIIEGAVVFTLLLINAAVGFVHEHRAQDALETLRSRLRPNARVLRDGSWTTIDAVQLVPDDTVHVRVGDVVPADLEVLDGDVSVDESVLTGESLPVERSAGASLYSASTIKRGEATAIVRATGPHTRFGLTADFIRSKDVGGHLHDRVFGIVRYLVAVDALFLLVYVTFSVSRATSPFEMVTFALTLLLGAIPVALPATFTLATALGAMQLARTNVLITRLSAIEDAAVMDILCVDKTGTLTENALSVDVVAPLPGANAEDVLTAAALASDAATQDPLDLAILAECTRRHVVPPKAEHVERHPFDPERKYAEAIFSGMVATKAAKGAPRAIEMLAGGGVEAPIADRMAAEGQRVLAVARDDGSGYRILGFIGFADPVRADAATLIAGVRTAGIRVMMLTGDTLRTARAVAQRLGLGEQIVSAEDVHRDITLVDHADAVARVLPEDKFKIVQRLQQCGHACGMTGDGVNDAPALSAAQVGIAVAGATDAAKAAASVVLTTPGLMGILPAIQESRRIFRRLSIYTTNKVTKTLELGLVLTTAALSSALVPLTPLLMILLMFGNDFATMAISADRVAFAPLPERWSSKRVVVEGGIFAIVLSMLSLVTFFTARDVLRLTAPQTQTVMFLLFVCSSQGLIYLLRDRRAFWRSRPARSLLIASSLDVIVSAAFAITGTLMAPIHAVLALQIIGAVLIYLGMIGIARLLNVQRSISPAVQRGGSLL